ncbi:MAG: hypothetical protein EOM34_00370 [Clostridia bacterium]|nr:hypothetical protein [Lachnospiraceae bacterium]NCB99120.1 hypothetical protein [Clostridia bacterium]NCD02176.1 hypothetical protein [Clostridia bacterium]
MINEQEYIWSEGTRIWKYQGGKSAGKGFSLQVNGGIILMVLFAFCAIIGMVVLTPKMEGMLNQKTVLWLQCFLIFGITALLMCGALYIGRRSNSMQLSFARREDGKLYVFDYRAPAFQNYLKGISSSSVPTTTAGSLLSVLTIMWNNVQIGKQIERIDKEQVLEKIIASGRIEPYGRHIISVKAIEQKRMYCRVYCSLRNGNGTIDDTSLMLTTNYKHYEELLGYIEQLSWNSAFDRKRSVSKYEKHGSLIRVLDIVLPILCIVFLAGGIATYILNANETYNYTKVQAVVTNCESDDGTFGRHRKPTVTVRYNGEDYKLQNVLQESWYYYQGRQVDAYAADGKLYANIEGIRSTSTLGKIYFVFLFGLMFLLIAMFTVKYIKKDIHMRSGKW